MSRIIQATNAGVVIFDGPRGSGKTTTALMTVAKLQKLGYRAEYFKKGVRSPRNEYTNMVQHLKDFLAVPDRIMVVDRFAATEWVMSTYYEREHASVLMNWMQHIDQELANISAIHIILLPDITTLERRIQDRKGHDWDMDKHAVRPLWNTVRELLGTSVLFTPTLPQDFDDLTDEVCRRVKRHWYPSEVTDDRQDPQPCADHDAADVPSST